MAQRNLSFHSDALQEAEAAKDWYAERSELAARAFVTELARAVHRVRESPNRWPRYGSSARRYIFQRFPFSLIYRTNDEIIEILAVAHRKRKPGYWKSR